MLCGLFRFLNDFVGEHIDDWLHHHRRIFRKRTFFDVRANLIQRLIEISWHRGIMLFVSGRGSFSGWFFRHKRLKNCMIIFLVTSFERTCFTILPFHRHMFFKIVNGLVRACNIFRCSFVVVENFILWKESSSNNSEAPFNFLVKVTFFFMHRKDALKSFSLDESVVVVVFKLAHIGAEVKL